MDNINIINKHVSSRMFKQFLTIGVLNGCINNHAYDWSELFQKYDQVDEKLAIKVFLEILKAEHGNMHYMSSLFMFPNKVFLKVINEAINMCRIRPCDDMANFAISQIGLFLKGRPSEVKKIDKWIIYYGLDKKKMSNMWISSVGALCFVPDIRYDAYILNRDIILSKINSEESSIGVSNMMDVMWHSSSVRYNEFHEKYDKDEVINTIIQKYRKSRIYKFKTEAALIIKSHVGWKIKR